ncbi:MAG: 30S ribosomal protein S20 [Selenomonadales bacterium]|nr:30S ribosomal protein S20 [Selenomonadales bacterium]
MPNIKSSIRSVKTDAELHAKNSAVKSSIRKAVRKLNEAIEAGQTEDAKNLLTNVVSGFDKAVQKGIVHKNTAARKKSRMAQKVNAMA